MLKTSILGIVIFTTIVLGSIMPILKDVVLKTLRTSHIDTSIVQTILQRSPRPSAPAQAQLLPGKSGEQREARHISTFHHTWRYVDDHFIKKYLIRKEAIEERKRKEISPQFQLERGVQTDRDSLMP